MQNAVLSQLEIIALLEEELLEKKNRRYTTVRNSDDHAIPLR